MVRVPAGSFLMGSTDAEVQQAFAEAKRYNKDAKLEWFTRETSQHRVTLSEFFMGRFQVTQAQWRAVAQLPKVKADLDPQPSYFKGNDLLPVEQASWHDAQEFCARLPKKSGKQYRLPSEAEWEYACRAGTTTPFAFGETITPQIVNYNGAYPYASAPKGEYREKTVPVGSLGVANGFGLYDLHGNVWEWCEDVWHPDYNGAPDDGRAWTTGGDQNYRVLRGGSWDSDGGHCRAAFRNVYGPGDRDYLSGFRVVVAARTP
jgi:formylglycine-generating enzyme required for sulfatase activity